MGQNGRFLTQIAPQTEVLAMISMNSHLFEPESLLFEVEDDLDGLANIVSDIYVPSWSDFGHFEP